METSCWSLEWESSRVAVAETAAFGPSIIPSACFRPSYCQALGFSEVYLCDSDPGSSLEEAGNANRFEANNIDDNESNMLPLKCPLNNPLEMNSG